MKERPILFNGAMVRAILDGRKTQARRVVKFPEWADPEKDGLRLATQNPATGLAFYKDGRPHKRMLCPYGQPGDRLWVRETWCPVNDGQFGETDWVDYRATPWDEESHPAGWHNAPDDPEALKWKPSIHMPRWASRLTLEVTGVWVKRLQDMTDADAAAEGILEDFGSGVGKGRRTNGCPFYTTTRAVKQETWDAIYGKKHPWENNPWVWVVEFKRVDENNGRA